MTESQTFYSSGDEDMGAISTYISDRVKTSHATEVVEGAERIKTLEQQLAKNAASKQKFLRELREIHEQAQQWAAQVRELLEKYGDERG